MFCVGDRVHSVAAAATLLFGSQSGVDPDPVEADIFEFHPTGQYPTLPSSHRVFVPKDRHGVSGYLDCGSITDEMLDRFIIFENFRRYFYDEHPEFRPSVCHPTDANFGPVLPDVPPSVFPVFCEMEIGWYLSHSAESASGIRGWSVSLSSLFLFCLVFCL